MSALPWLLLATTLCVRWLAGNKNPWAWRLDLLTVLPWAAFYVHAEAYPLAAIPFVFGAIDLRNLQKWSPARRGAA